MGKKTDEKISAIKTALSEWKTVDERVARVQASMESAVTLRDKAYQAYEAYYTAKGWSRDSSKNEDEMFRDAGFVKLDQALNNALAYVGKLEKELILAKAERKAALDHAKKLLLDLNAHVMKKQADKTFAWQKSSVAGATTFIKETMSALGIG